MKKTILLLLLTLAMLLCACTYDPVNTDTTQSDTSSIDQDAPKEDRAYQNIECYAAKKYTKLLFGFEGDNYTLNLNCPEEWNITKTSDTVYTVKRNGNTIGTFRNSAATDSNEWKAVKSDDFTDYDLYSCSYIEKNGSGDSLRFRYRFSYQYTEGEKNRELTLVVDYAEVNEFTAKKLLIGSMLSNINTESNMGLLSKEEKNNILILGNSFIGTSNIGTILSEMMKKNGKSGSVNAQSRGYATVETYINDSSMMSNIRNGRYDIIFICGFYSAKEIDNLAILKEACDVSGTKLVIFPAHNESANVISSVSGKYDSVAFLDWKGEIDALISNGVDQWDLCFNDQHKHSTSLVGYVGAHMIYRALYNAVPTQGPSESISQDSVDSLLGNYSKTGYITLIDKTTIKFFG